MLSVTLRLITHLRSGFVMMVTIGHRWRVRGDEVINTRNRCYDDDDELRASQCRDDELSV